MNLKLKIGQFINWGINWLIKTNIRLVSFLPNGRFLVLDLKRAGIYPKTIFDVGANLGQTGLYYHYHFNQSRIFCFEPVKATYSRMVENTKNTSVICINKALGDKAGEMEIYKSDTDSDIASINGSGINFLSQSEVIAVDTGENICLAHNVEMIDLLKIDVEGYEIQALNGFNNLLQNKVKVIYIEAGFDQADACKTYISDILSYLQPHGFIATGFYDSYRVGKAKLKLNHTDLLLINTNLVEI